MRKKFKNCLEAIYVTLKLEPKNSGRCRQVVANSGLTLCCFNQTIDIIHLIDEPLVVVLVFLDEGSAAGVDEAVWATLRPCTTWLAHG